MTIVGISYVGDKWSNSFSKLFIGHYARLTFIHKVSLYSFPSAFVTLLFESIPISNRACLELPVVKRLVYHAH